MRIENIELYNFRQYIGTQKIEFSQDTERNVTVLVGKNTSGKTTLIRAFEWCLYRTIRFEDEILLNSQVADHMNEGETQDVSVTISLWHKYSIDDKETRYVINRKATYLCTGIDAITGKRKISLAGPFEGKVQWLNDDGQTYSDVDAGSVNASITRLLPQDLSGYFFLTGERIGAITENKDLKDSVRGLMGLNVLENTMNHLKKILSAYNNALKQSGNVNLENAQKMLDEKQTQLDKLAEEILKVQDAVDFYQNEKAECAANLKKNNNVIEDQKRREQLESIIEDTKNAVSIGKTGMSSAFSVNAFSFFLKPLSSKVNEFMEKVADEVDCVPDMTQSAIDYIINVRKKCICGTEASKGTLAYQQLIIERQKMPPENIGSAARRYQEYTNQYAEMGDNYFSTIESKYKDYRRNKKELSRRLDEKQNIDKSLGNGSVDAKALNSAYNNAVSMLEKKSREIKSLFEKQGALKREIENCNNVINELLKKDKSNLKLRGYITYTQKLFDWVNEAYTSKEVAIRSQLEMKVNSNFSRMYHGNRNILIDSKYRVKYMDITTEESDGLKAVKNFAFVSGLVELAKEALTGEDDLELGTQSFPMVMDAPFSNIDEIHIANICSILPDVAEQVIIAVMQKDWDQAADKLSNRIGKSYMIEKDIDSKGCEIETSTHFREV